MKKNYGWIPDLPDLRDHLYGAAMKAAAKLQFPLRGWLPCKRKPDYPSVVDLRTGGPVWPAIMDQGDLGSCVDNAWAAALAFTESKETGNKPGTLLSRLFLYYNVRGGKPVDSGSTIRDGIKTVANVGICDESIWPYDTAQWMTKPSDPAYANALPRKNIEYARLVTQDDMLHCLANGYPIVFGVSLYKGFDDTGADGLVITPTGKEEYEGGHSMCIVGYNLAQQVFLVRNSWGPNWAMKGFCWMDFKYLMSPMLADDFWTCRTIPVTP